MSYSFSITASNKAQAKKMVAEKFAAEVLPNQPGHKADAKQMQKAAEAYIDLLDDRDDLDVQVIVGGGLNWSDNETKKIAAAHFTVQCFFMARPAPEV